MSSELPLVELYGHNQFNIDVLAKGLGTLTTHESFEPHKVGAAYVDRSIANYQGTSAEIKTRLLLEKQQRIGRYAIVSAQNKIVGDMTVCQADITRLRTTYYSPVSTQAKGEFSVGGFLIGAWTDKHEDRQCRYIASAIGKILKGMVVSYDVGLYTFALVDNTEQSTFDTALTEGGLLACDVGDFQLNAGIEDGNVPLLSNYVLFMNTHHESFKGFDEVRDRTSRGGL